MKRAVRIFVAALAATLATQVEAQQRAGVVTTLEGRVTVSRASLSQPAPLRFKDDIFVSDRIATGKDSVARILLGGRAVVTVREQSTVTITEAPSVATVDVATGRVAVAVAREKMRPGDVVEVKTPNAVAGIRGTVIVAEVFSASHSVITVLKGTIDVTRLEAGRLVGAATLVNAQQRVSIVGHAPVSAPQRIGPDAARRLGQEFRVAPPRQTPAAATAAVNAAEVDRAAKDLAALPRSVAGERRLRTNAPDDDQDDITQESRGAPGREKWERVGKVDDAPGRTDSALDAAPAMKNYGRSIDPDATKNYGKSGRGNRGRGH